MDCPLREDKDLCMTYNPKIFELITRKYTLTILLLLDKYGALRFNEIMRKIDGITQRSLSIRLKEMEESLLIKREIVNNRPIVINYSITIQGKAVKNAILMLLQLTNLISPTEKDYFA
ncbi:winged helix-turn-helix transcriptional regulator [Acidianus brierleyi]|uniref:Transcriptional regulator n=1 Tax=Acidianus brierleyi TaxID=41673 RepID=A0A2U9IHU4_9CREN|nr:helix-turn-helix domain-containing protein [Acidianus brierleyi]AWR95556.1 transcriptional regulator [Acidianus brierleyi]